MLASSTSFQRLRHWMLSICVRRIDLAILVQKEKEELAHAQQSYDDAEPWHLPIGHPHGLTVERPKLIVRNVDWPCLDKFSFPQEARVQILRRRRSKGRGVVCRKSSCGVACSRKTFSPTLQAVRSNPSVCLLCICVTCVRRPVPHLCTPRYIKHVTVTNLRTISYALLRANYIAN